MFSKRIVVGMIAFVFALMAFGYSTLSDSNAADEMLSADVDHLITLEEGIQYTTRYRATIEEGERVGGFIGREMLESILEQEDAVGVRYYYAMDKDGNPTLVLVGADKFGHDIVEGPIAQKLPPCPPYCSMESPLASDLTIQ